MIIKLMAGFCFIVVMTFFLSNNIQSRLALSFIYLYNQAYTYRRFKNGK